MSSYYNKPVQEVFELLATSTTGLSDEEVLLRRQSSGLNRLQTRPPTPAWRILLNQFASFIIYLLLFAVLFSIMIGEYIDSLVILAILVMNGLIGFFQELHANRSLEALKKLATVTATVTRNGSSYRIGSEELVYGDIIHLENGDKIPADARLITAVSLQVEESALTGESEAVEKKTTPLGDNLPIGDQTNMVFSSTAVVNGRGMAVVTACGMQTEIGRITRMVSEAAEERTPLQRRLDRFGRNLGLVIIAICTLVFLLSIGRTWTAGIGLTNKIFLDFAFIAISLAVAAVPTALPAVVTIALSIGTTRLLAKNMLVRRLTSVETLGSCNVICSDKTGTLTKNEMTVTRLWTLSGEVAAQAPHLSEQCTTHYDLALLLEIGLACNNSDITQKDGKLVPRGSPTELALRHSAQQAGIDFCGTRLAEIPFDTQRKYMSVIIDNDSSVLLYSKGAPDHLLQRCSQVQVGDRTEPLTKQYSATIHRANEHFAGQAMRVIAFAYKELKNVDTAQETDLVFVGLQAMIDPPRDEVMQSIVRAARARIRSIMITGDHRETAKAIGANIGIHGNILTGKELDTLSDADLTRALSDTNIFARVIPEHKQRIVKALQQLGHVVAMTGDGVNDAPALKNADIGIAVGSGTDVAKEASDFVLLDDSFASIVDAVEEGRGIYDNIQKSIMLLLSGNLMEVLIIFLAVLLDFNLPLSAILLLWINLITDGAPALAYSVDPYSATIMQRPPIPMSEGILPARQLKLLITLGVTGTLIGLGLFFLAGGNSPAKEQLQTAQTLVFNYIVLYELVLVFVIRRSYTVRLFSNPWLWLAVAVSCALQAIILYTPLHNLFHITPLYGRELLYLFGAIAIFSAVCLFFRNVGMKQPGNVLPV